MDVVPVSELSEKVGQKRINKKNEIVDHVLKRLKTESIHALSLNKIAREMSYSPAALYRYFPSWGVLLAEVLQRVIHNIDLTIEQGLLELKAATSETSTHEERVLFELFSIVRSYYQFSRDYPQQFALLSNLTSDSKVLVNDEEAEVVVADGLKIFFQISRLIELGEKQDLFVKGDAAARSLTLWASLQGILQSKKIARFAQQEMDFAVLSLDCLSSHLLLWGLDHKACEQAKIRYLNLF